MKKITFLFTLLISFWGFSQNLVTNGDFQTGAAPWTGSALNVVDLGGSNFVNQANVAAAGNPWDANLSQVINLTSGKIYLFKFDAFTATATGTRTLIAGLGQTGAPYLNSTSTFTLTSTPQTFSSQITINYGEAVTDRVIFDMGAAAGFVFIDNVSVVEVLPLIQNFEAPVTYTTVGGFNGAVASFVTDPSSGAANGQVFKGVQGPGGDLWQGIEFVQTTKKAKLTTNKTMTADVYCTQAFNLLAKVAQGGVGAPESATGQAYTTPGQWQTITFNFAVSMDNTAAANGEYQKIIFFGNWNSTNNGWNNPVVPLTFYIDNIRAEETIIPVVMPLIQNFETPVTYTLAAGFEGAAASFTTDPAGGANGQVFKGVQGPGAGSNLWQGIEFVQTTKSAKLTTNKTMSVDVYCSQAFNVLAKVTQGGVGAPDSANGQAYTTPNQWQTLTFNFNSPMDGTGVANGEYPKISFFGNWNSTNNGWNNPIVPLTYYLDNVRAEEAAIVIIVPPAGPTVNSPTPPNRLASEVVSIYSDAYTSISPLNFDAGWCGTSSVEQTTAGGAGNNVTYYKGNACQGMTFPSAVQDFTGLTNLHVDLFIATGTSLIGKVFHTKIVPTSGGTVTEFNIDLNALSPAPVPGTWYSYDKVISYNGPTSSIHEFAVTSNLNNVVWYDNLYFHKNTVLSTDSFAVSKVKLYPNPASNVLNIESAGTIQNIAIYNVLGQEVMNKLTNQTLVSLDVSGLNAGVYVIKTAIDGTVSSTKFIKE